MIVTIDGTSASGKSTTAIKVAQKLGLVYIDTGAMYRAVAFSCIEQGVDLSDQKRAAEISYWIDIGFALVNGNNHVFLNGRDVTNLIRTEKVGKAASLIATYKGVRKNLVKKQRDMGKRGNVICEGRDIGTVVFKDADIKIYMDANIEERAKRRCKELGKKDDLDTILESVKKRDERDKTRKESPLKVPDGAILIDTTNLSIEEEVEKVIEIIRDYKEKIENPIAVHHKS